MAEDTTQTPTPAMQPQPDAGTPPEELQLRLREDYGRDDERWSRASQTRDWIILIVIGLIDFLWMLIIFLTERGIR